MNKREWSPGDVALIKWRDFPEALAIKVGGRWRDTANATFDDREDMVTVRPLVVIDPEDREQAKRLTQLMFEVVNPFDGRIADTQAALREFANPTPPKPPEPQGLGAVVEDTNGEQWVRGPSHNSWKWLRADRPGCESYAEINAVRILREGWVRDE